MDAETCRYRRRLCRPIAFSFLFLPFPGDPSSSRPLGRSSVEGCVWELACHCLALSPEAKAGHLDLRTWVPAHLLRGHTAQGLSPHSENGSSVPTWRCSQRGQQTSSSVACTQRAGSRELESLWNERRLDPFALRPRPLPPADENGINLLLTQPCSHLGGAQRGRVTFPWPPSG